MRVLLINPNTNIGTTEQMAAQARDVLPVGWQLATATALRGAAMITNEAELAIAIGEVVRIGTLAPEAQAAQALVIAAFGNPGLDELRARVAKPVVGIGEASLREAAGAGRRFAVATTTPELAESIDAAVRQYGLAAHYAGSFIPPGDPLALAAQPALQRERLAQAVQQALHEGGAEAVVIGGGPLAQVARDIAPRFSIPVISPVDAAMRAVARLLGA